MFNAQMKRKEFNMTPQEKQLIDAIKAQPNFSVFPGNGCVVVAYTYRTATGIRVSQGSIWLGRSSTIDRLQETLLTAMGL